jgi:hypothetical protein
MAPQKGLDWAAVPRSRHAFSAKAAEVMNKQEKIL